MIKTPFVLFPGNTVPIQWALVAGATGAAVTDATGTLTIFDGAGVAVPGASALPMLPTTTPGLYQATILGASFNPPTGSDYRTVITMNSLSVGGPGTWTLPTIVRFRTTP